MLTHSSPNQGYPDGYLALRQEQYRVMVEAGIVQTYRERLGVTFGAYMFRQAVGEPITPNDESEAQFRRIGLRAAKSLVSSEGTILAAENIRPTPITEVLGLHQELLDGTLVPVSRVFVGGVNVRGRPFVNIPFTTGQGVLIRTLGMQMADFLQGI